MKAYTGMSLTVALCMCAFAQTTTPAGGKWTRHETVDKMTDRKITSFRLYYDKASPDGARTREPLIAVICGGGQEASYFADGILAGRKPDLQSSPEVSV